MNLTLDDAQAIIDRAPGGPAPGSELTNGGLIPYAGGAAVHDHDGSLIGAIGVSGGLPEQDGEVARAGQQERTRA